MSLEAVQILQKSLEDAQKGMSNTDDEIRRLTGRDPHTRPLYRTKTFLFRIFVILLSSLIPFPGFHTRGGGGRGGGNMGIPPKNL